MPSSVTTPAASAASTSTLSAAVTGLAAAAKPGGYWEVASNGGVFAAGTAVFAGSMAGHALAARVVGIAGDAVNGGYWEVASDGGIFSFGDAGFYGSMGGKALRAPVVGMASTPDGKGYWLVASDGGIFSFGDAGFYGSMGGKSFGSSITGFAATPGGKGYWLAAADGAVFNFGDAAFEGDATVESPAHPYLPPSNPLANVVPDPVYTFQPAKTYTSSLPCWQLTSGAWVPEAGTAQCVDAEIAATDAARAGAEGLGPIRLPSDFASLTPQEQLFVLVDIERVSRGEPPVAGLAPSLDSDAQDGAEAGRDPTFTFGALPSSTWWGSNYVGGALDALDANFTWMYEDGYGGYNIDCTSPTAPGCWGHRDNELTSDHGGTLVMGAGVVAQPTGTLRMSELFVAVGDPADVPPLTYTWAEAVAAGAAG